MKTVVCTTCQQSFDDTSNVSSIMLFDCCVKCYVSQVTFDSIQYPASFASESPISFKNWEIEDDNFNGLF